MNQQKPEKPIHRCGATIDGPKVARHVVAWRKYCRNRVKNEGDRCHLHPVRTR